MKGTPAIVPEPRRMETRASERRAGLTTIVLPAVLPGRVSSCVTATNSASMATRWPALGGSSCAASGVIARARSGGTTVGGCCSEKAPVIELKREASSGASSGSCERRSESPSRT